MEERKRTNKTTTSRRYSVDVNPPATSIIMGAALDAGEYHYYLQPLLGAKYRYGLQVGTHASAGLKYLIARQHISNPSQTLSRLLMLPK